jgi:REP element-mobilizing transposase RayT
MSGRQFLKAFVTGKNFLPISNPQLNGMELLHMCIAFMDTHYHLFIETPSVKLSKIMQHINGAYTTYFNRKHKRSGYLFQGRN